MNPRVTALMGTGLVDPDAPILTADDLGVLRGDGVFETLLVRGGQPWLVDEHLHRMAGSAQRLELPAPPATAWHDLVRLTLSAWDPRVEGALKLVCTRGRAITGRPTAYTYLTPVGAETLRQRAEGITVRTLDLGISSSVRARAPWLLGGAKTLSYAQNMAAQRFAQGQQVDDVIYLSGEGEVLEAPTASVVWARDGRLLTIPVETGILAGTTVGRLLQRAGTQGFGADVATATVDDLHAADGVWLLSSVRTVATVRSLDGRARGDGGLTQRVLAALDPPPLSPPPPSAPQGYGTGYGQPAYGGQQWPPPGQPGYPAPGNPAGPQAYPAPGPQGQPPAGPPAYPPPGQPPQGHPVDPYGSPPGPGGWR